MKHPIRYWGYSDRPDDISTSDVRALILELLDRQCGTVISRKKIVNYLLENGVEVNLYGVAWKSNGFRKMLISMGLVVIGQSVIGKEHYRLPT